MGGPMGGPMGPPMGPSAKMDTDDEKPEGDKLLPFSPLEGGAIDLKMVTTPAFDGPGTAMSYSIQRFTVRSSTQQFTVRFKFTVY